RGVGAGADFSTGIDGGAYVFVESGLGVYVGGCVETGLGVYVGVCVGVVIFGVLFFKLVSGAGSEEMDFFIVYVGVGVVGVVIFGVLFFKLVSGAGSEEMDFFIRLHLRAPSLGKQRALTRIAEALHLDQALVNHYRGVAGRRDGDVELSAA